jgi:hypothetical protein
MKRQVFLRFLHDVRVILSNYFNGLPWEQLSYA